MKERSLNELHLFAGAGGGILGGILLGHTCVCAVEIEPYCRKVLLQRQRDGILPKFPIWDDVRTFDGKPWRGLIDVVCGGFPCQDISAQGKKTGIEGKQSGLWKEMARIVGEVSPRFVFIENSPMLRGSGLTVVLKSLSEMGYDAAWCVLGACDVGANHKRKRIWILAHPKMQPWIYQSNHRKKEKRLSNDGNPWQTNPWDAATTKLCRMDDGVANRLDRTVSIGNGQVPAVVKLAWETLTCAC